VAKSQEKKLFVYMLGLIPLCLMPLLVNTAYAHHLMIMTGLAVVLAASNRLILVSGAWFMGHAAFYAIGAYGVVLLRAKAGSVAFVEIIRLTIIKIDYLGGQRALRCPPPEAILGIDFSSKLHYYYFILLIVCFTFFILKLIEKSSVGAALKVIAENESLAESIGINTVRYKVVTLAICAFFGGIAGAFYSPYVAVTGPTSFTVWTSIMILFYAVIGGLQSIWGPVIGAAFLTLLPEILPARASYQNIAYAAIVLGSLFFLPDGLTSFPALIKNRIHKNKAQTQNRREVNAGRS